MKLATILLNERKTFINLKPHRVLPRWNYTISPHTQFRKTEKNGLEAIETRRWARMDVNVPAIQTKPTEVGWSA